MAKLGKTVKQVAAYTSLEIVKLLDVENFMHTTMLFAGVAGTIVSAVAMHIFYELSVAYWAPNRADQRWRSLIHLPKFLYFAPTFRWLMPLLAIIMIVQLFISLRMIFAGISLS
ncbi:MAG: hypothetical protein AAF387_01655 [Pseudomonadota bacterium]